MRGKQLNQALILTDYNEPPENLLINEEKTTIPEEDTNYFKKLLQLFTSTHDWLIMDRISPSYMPTETEWRKAFGGTYSNNVEMTVKFGRKAPRPTSGTPWLWASIENAESAVEEAAPKQVVEQEVVAVEKPSSRDLYHRRKTPMICS